MFLSYSSKDPIEAIEKTCSVALQSKRISAWYDRSLIAGQPYRDVLRERIEAVKAVVVLWERKLCRLRNGCAPRPIWRIGRNKLICLRDPKLDPARIPMPFAANHHMVEFGKLPELLEALALKGAKPRI